MRIEMAMIFMDGKEGEEEAEVSLPLFSLEKGKKKKRSGGGGVGEEE